MSAQLCGECAIRGPGDPSDAFVNPRKNCCSICQLLTSRPQTKSLSELEAERGDSRRALRQADNRHPHCRGSPNSPLAPEAYAAFGRVHERLDWRAGNRRRKTMSQPAHKIRIGSLQATIWRNSGQNGNWYSANLTRGFKTDEGWRETDSLGYDDLLAAGKLLDLTHTWIMHQIAADSKGRKESEQKVS
jgi:hypothetical protein